MKPRLYNMEGTSLIGSLEEAISCKITEDVNGVFELEGELPPGTDVGSKLKVDQLIYAKYLDRYDYFRIYRIEEALYEPTRFYAEHLSYQANYIVVANFQATASVTIPQALNLIRQNIKTAQGTSPFTLSTDFASAFIINVNTPYSVKEPTQLRKVLIDLATTCGGQIEWNNREIKILKRRGAGRSERIEYGKDLVNCTRILDGSDRVNGVYMYSTYNNRVYGGWPLVSAVNPAPYFRIQAVNVNEYLGSSSPASLDGTIYTNYIYPMLKAKEKYSEAVTEVVKAEAVSMVKLYGNDYTDYNLYDNVMVVYNAAGDKVTTSVTKVVYDVLGEYNESITLGSYTQDFYNYLARR